jgi:hypothetical protein
VPAATLEVAADAHAARHRVYSFLADAAIREGGGAGQRKWVPAATLEVAADAHAARHRVYSFLADAAIREGGGAGQRKWVPAATLGVAVVTPAGPSELATAAPASAAAIAFRVVSGNIGRSLRCDRRVRSIGRSLVQAANCALTRRPLPVIGGR